MAEKSQDIKAIFKAKVTEQLDLHPNQWAGDDSVAVVLSVVKTLTDADGKPITLTPHEEDVIKLASKPTTEVAVGVIKQITEDHKATLDKTVEALLRRVISAPAFKVELAKAGFIKEQSASALKDLLG
jgi:ABC-type Fe3+-hydroxamate transport system substrate-binding protein